MRTKRAILFIVLFFCLWGKLATQSQTIDSPEQILRSAKTDSQRVILFNEISNRYMLEGDMDKAGEYSVKGKTLAEKIGYLYGTALVLNTMGNINWNRSNFPLAIQNFSKALEIGKRIGNKKIIADNYNSLGIIDDVQGFHNTALEKYLVALKIRKEIKDSVELAHTYIDIAVVYYGDHQNKKALENYFEAVNITKKIRHQRFLSDAYTGIGEVYGNMCRKTKNADSVIFFRKKALEYDFLSQKIKTEINHRSGIASNYFNIGVVYSEAKEYDLALKYFLLALNIYQEIKDRMFEALTDYQIGKIYIDQEKYSAASEYLEKTLLINKEIGSRDGIMEGFYSLSFMHSKQKDFKKAYEYYKMGTELHDSLLNEKITRQTTEMQAKYETEKKGEQIEILSRENTIKDLELKRNSFVIVGLIISAILLVVIGYLVYQRKSLKTQHAKAKLEKELLQSNMTALRAQMNPHFIFNSLNSIQGLVNVNENKKASRFIAKFSKLTRGILNYSENAKISLQEEMDFLKNYIEIESLRFDNNFSYTMEADPGADLENTQIPSLIVQPIIENAIVHGLFHQTGEKKLEITIKEEEGFVIWTITDNGIGIKRSKEKKPQERRHISKGLQIIKDRLKILTNFDKQNGSIEFADLGDLGTGTGTRVTIKMPIL